MTFGGDKDTLEDFEGLSTKLRREEEEESVLGGEAIGETAAGGLSAIIVVA